MEKIFSEIYSEMTKNYFRISNVINLCIIKCPKISKIKNKRIHTRDQLESKSWFVWKWTPNVEIRKWNFTEFALFGCPVSSKNGRIKGHYLLSDPKTIDIPQKLMGVSDFTDAKDHGNMGYFMRWYCVTYPITDIHRLWGKISEISITLAYYKLLQSFWRSSKSPYKLCWSVLINKQVFPVNKRSDIMTLAHRIPHVSIFIILSLKISWKFGEVMG